jgi:nitroreductase
VSHSINGENFSEFVRSRRSIRNFKPDPIPEEILNRILDDAKWAPSWTNTQPYFFAIATGEKRDRISRAYLELFDKSLDVQHGKRFAKLKMFLTGVAKPDGDFDTTKPYPDVLVPYRRKTGHDLYSWIGIDRKDRKGRDEQWRKNFEFFGAPVVIFVFIHDGLKQFAAQDAGIVEQTLMLSAHANGVGSCAQGALATWGSPVRAEFDIPKDYKFISGISLGYANDDRINSFNAGRRDIDSAR